jgi:hypothetical protein
MSGREHLYTAWTEALPLAAESAFSHALLELDRSDRPDDANRALRDEQRAWLRTRSRGASTDNSALLCARAWWVDAPVRTDRRKLAPYLCAIAGRYLAHAGSNVTLAAPGQLRALADAGSPTDAPTLAARWRWLTLALPQDSLVAARCASADAPPIDAPSDRVDLLPVGGSRLLEEPCAETHMHIGASTSFAQLWAGWIGLGIDGFIQSKHGQTWSWPLGGQPRFSAIATSAALVRLLLASFLHVREARASALSMRAFVAREQRRHELHTLSGAAQILARAVATLHHPNAPETDARDAARLYRRLCARRSRTAPSHHGLDPLSVLYGPHTASPETRFETRAIRWLLHNDDALFELLFWQYLRFRVQVFRWLTFEPGTSGLDWFDTFNDRLRVFAPCIDPVIPRLAAQHANTGLALSALEARTTFWSPPVAATITGTLRWFAVGAVAEQRARARAGSRAPLEVAMILHFVKSASDPRTGRRWDRPIHGVSARWASWITHAMARARAVEAALKYRPSLLLLLRGVDLCGRELSMPSWPAVLPLLHVRRASRRASAVLSALRPEWSVPPMSVTLHAGEDFRRSVEGLRRVHEWIEAAVLEPGDRIGHGVSLGEAPEHRTPVGAQTLQPTTDRLDDLLWEFALYSRGVLQAPAGRSVFVEQEILRLSRAMYGAQAGAIALAEHVRARQLRFDDAQLRRALDSQHPSESRAPRGGAAWLLAQHFDDELVFERGEKPIEVTTTAAELEFARDAQRMLRTRVAREQITVESNPSSNHLIADLDSLNEHPALSLQPLPGVPRDEPSVLLSINTDDPVLFATSLADEFAHIYYALVRRGVSAQDAVEWIDRVRANGYRSRFTVKASADPVVLGELVRG